MRDWKGKLKKGSLVTLITLGTIGAGTVYYQAGKFVTEKADQVINVIVKERQVEKAQMERLVHVIEASYVQSKSMQNIIQSEISKHVEAIRYTNITYTVTEEQDEDGYYKTINNGGEEVWLSDIETDKMELHKGDRVQVTLNEYGELVSIMKVTN